MNTSTSRTYADKLKDPRWQKRRLEILNAADWKCEICDDATQELHVHHRQYIKGHEPWEYWNDDLECLCSTCHSLRHIDQTKLAKYARAKRLNVVSVRLSDRPHFTNGWLYEICDERGKMELHALRARWRLGVENLLRAASDESGRIISQSSARKAAQP